MEPSAIIYMAIIRSFFSCYRNNSGTADEYSFFLSPPPHHRHPCLRTQEQLGPGEQMGDASEEDGSSKRFIPLLSLLLIHRRAPGRKKRRPCTTRMQPPTFNATLCGDEILLFLNVGKPNTLKTKEPANEGGRGGAFIERTLI